MLRTGSAEAARVAGGLLVALGILGFIPDVSGPVSGITFAGHGSATELLGLFRVSILLNLVYVVAGCVGFVFARTERGARRFLTGAGIAFLLLWLLGVVKAGGWIPVNVADNWLHLGLGIVLIGTGYVTARPATT